MLCILHHVTLHHLTHRAACMNASDQAHDLTKPKQSSKKAMDNNDWKPEPYWNGKLSMLLNRYKLIS